MKKKLLTVSITVIISVIGMICLQTDWLIKTYQTEYEKKSDKADVALRLALAKFHIGQTDSVTKLLWPKLKPLADTVHLKFPENNDSLIIEFRNKVTPAPKGVKEISGSIGHAFGRIVIEHYFRNLTGRSDVNASEIFGQDSLSETALRKIFADRDSTRAGFYFKTDSAKIIQLTQLELERMGENMLAGKIHLRFRQGYNAPVHRDKNSSTFYKPYRAQGINGYYGAPRLVAVSYSALQGIVALRLLLYLFFSCLLTFLLIFSIVYLMKLILRQKQLADMKDDFINNLTHEFKTPIATVSAAVEGLQKFNAIDDKEKTNRYLEISRTELNRLNDMVTKVLNISSYEKKNLELEMQTVDLDAMVGEVVQAETFRAVKPVTFSVKIAPGIKQITADALHLKNVLTNLVDNSVKYSGESVAIDITAQADNGIVHIKVKDNGIGIPASALKFVFDKFYRVTNGNLYNVKGNGLGLNYVKFAVEAHGGTISVKSEINVGTEFLIALPLK